MSEQNHSPDPEQSLDRLYAHVRRRLRARWALEGVTVALILLLLAALIAVAVMAAARFDPASVDAARLAVYLLAGALLGSVLLTLLIQRLPDKTIARYMENFDPQLDALLVTAAEARRRLQQPTADDSTSPVLARRLIARAVQQCETSGMVSRLERRRLKRAGSVLGTTLALVLLLGLFGPLPLQHGLGLLFAPSDDPAAGNPYVIQVTPGNNAVLQGDDQRIVATPAYFQPERLELVSRSGPEQPWTRTAMNAAADSADFESFFFNLDSAQDYYIDAGDVRSEVYRIDVIPRPTVARIDLHYTFPAQTGRAPEQVENSGDISAVRGTSVEVQITPSVPVSGGRLVLNGEQAIELQAVDGTLRATIPVQENGYYHVELPAGERLAPASPEYAIATWEDRLPNVALLQPGRDRPATRIEEVGFAVRADDDVGLGALELVLSVNGAADEVIPLKHDAAPATELTGTHTLYLEERALEPGDLIAYYVRARDTATADDPARQVATDMFFIDVRPFEQHFRRAPGGGGGGGMGGGQQEAQLAAQQRDLVVALFKTSRDRDSLTDDTYRERLATLAEIQARIRERVEAIARRIQSRPDVELNKGYRRMVEELPKAAEAMIDTESKLTASDVEQALPAARTALLHLQRADAAFRDVQIAQAQAGGGGSAAASDLNNLFRLEMDKFQNPYADVQRGQQQNPQQQQIDETLRKLEELARRQQQEIERAALRAERGQGGAASQQALLAELEKMVRELERLSRERQDPQLAATAEQLKQAAESMRQAATQNQGQSGQQSQQGTQQGTQQGSPTAAQAAAQALDRLRQAQQLLDGGKAAQLASGINEALQQSEDLQDAAANRQADDAAAELAEQTAELRQKLAKLAADAQQQQQAQAGGRLKQAERTLASNEPGDGVALQAARDHIAAAREAVAGTAGDQQERVREQVRSLARTLEAARNQQVEQARLGAGNADPGEFRSALGGQAQELANAVTELDATGPAEDIQALIAAIVAATPQEMSGQYDEWLAALKLIERELRSDTEQERPAIIATQRAEPAAADRERVEAYYRGLSESRVQQ